MKKIVVLVFIIFGYSIFALPSSSGATGIIDFPDAYNLRINNYTVAAAVTGIDKATAFQLMLEGGFIPQLEAGMVLSSKDTMINESLLKANIKFQFVQEADNPAIAIGFVETKDYNGADDVYGYVVASKRFADVFAKDTFLSITGGIKYDKNKDVNAFTALEVPIFSLIKITGELYTYKITEYEKDNSGANIGDGEKNTKYSFNIGGEFYTTQNIRTKLWWKEANNTVGLSIAYIGIYK